MNGRSMDNLLFGSRQAKRDAAEGCLYLDTDFGRVRVLDTGTPGPVVLNVPDGPNVIEHQLPLIRELSSRFRVVCFEYPGLGFSYPNRQFDYSCSSGADLLVQLMDMLGISTAALLFSCSNGFYALQAAQDHPERISRLFLSQTPSLHAMSDWSRRSVPGVLKLPYIGQVANAILAKRLVNVWYRYSLPRDHPERPEYARIAENALAQGGCFCLASLTQGLARDRNTHIQVEQVPTTLVWGPQDFTHRHTEKASILDHVRDCEIIEFPDCGHFPELESTARYVAMIADRF